MPGVYSACIAADAGYLPFREAGDESTVLVGRDYEGAAVTWM